MKQLPRMGYRTLITLLAVSFAAQSQPNCTGVTLDVDARCACVKDPHSQLCAMVKSGFYEPPDYAKEMQASWGLGGKIAPPPANGTAAPSPSRPVAPPRPQQARVAPWARTSYLRL